MIEQSNNQHDTDNHLLPKPLAGERIFFKVKFAYTKERIGRCVWSENIKVFDVVDSDELHKKIDDYIRTRSRDIADTWYHMKMVDVNRI